MRSLVVSRSGRRARPLSALPIAVAVAAAGCAGHASVRYQGTVTAGPDSGHRFDAAANAWGGDPIEGAEVTLYVNGDVDCGAPQRSRVRGAPPHVRTTRTDDQGRFDTGSVIFGGTVLSKHPMTLCVLHPDHEPYRYRVDYDKTGDPKRGEYPLNVRVRRRSDL
jgi:hypothetical protein